MKVGGYSVAMDLVVQQKMVLLRDFIKRGILVLHSRCCSCYLSTPLEHGRLGAV